MNECERHRWMVHTGSGRVYCRNCDAKLGPREVEERLNAVERLEAVAEAAQFLCQMIAGNNPWVVGTSVPVMRLRRLLAAAGYEEDE